MGILGEHLRDVRFYEKRSIFISEPVTSKTAGRVVADLLSLDEDKKETIFLYLNSPGGEVHSGFAIFDTIRYIESPVKVITTGLCASIATIINVAVPRKFRFAMPHAKFLIHQPLISGEIYGQASDIEITANQILRTRAQLNKILAEECGKELSKLEEDTMRDYWMLAEEACAYGLIGKVIKSKTEIA